ncbi:MAG: hypothetical protein IPG04_42030 [Polyangiaceae bacterium]|nr:hypothetical protein [Polyangiaceae bacterium]
MSGADTEIDVDADADADTVSTTMPTPTLMATPPIPTPSIRLTKPPPWRRAVELQRARELLLEKPIGAPVGTAVPAGTWTIGNGARVSDPDWRVVALWSPITGGLVDLDVTGDGVADSASPVDAIVDQRGRANWLATALLR